MLYIYNNYSPSYTIISLYCYIFIFLCVLCVFSVFYKADFCSPKDLPNMEGGGIAVVTGRKVQSVTNSITLYTHITSPSALYTHITSPSALYTHITSPSALYTHITSPSALYTHITSPSALSTCVLHTLYLDIYALENCV